MRPAITKAVWSLGACSLLMILYPFTGSAEAAWTAGAPQCTAVFKASLARPTAAPSPQVQHDAQADASFFFSLARDGALRMTLKAGELEAAKTVYHDGRFRIVLQAGEDRVSVVVGPAVLDVQRGKRHVHIDVGQDTDDDWLAVKTLLAGSKALRLFRALAYNLDPSALREPAGASIVSSDAILGYLDGDLAAVARLAQQMRTARQSRIRTVVFRLDGGNACWDRYEADVVEAAEEYDQCRHAFKWYDPRQAGCVLVWTLQVESAWFQFLACSAIPLKTE